MYDHRKIEKKWQSRWAEQNPFAAKADNSKEKYYILDMFPYPSGSGLHVGHVSEYAGTDAVARHKRQLGKNVLYPMGWDSFGLPAEQFAIRTGTHPAETTETNIANYKRQLLSLGNSYDWDREFRTSDPSYYKWTQWLFTKLYEKGLAYEAEVMVNFCPALGTVLANEEVQEGKSVEGGHPVERRPLKQWVLKITAYADRLLEDLKDLDWPEGLKKLQTNWIGKSRGANVKFPIEGDGNIEVYTTRPDTLFGATFMVLAPEHPLVKVLTTPEQAEAVAAYQKKAAAKSDLARTDLAKEKSGVWTGGYATNPVTGKPVPVWIADYVLMGYGTGAIMAVPSNDSRDFAFAKQYDLPINPVFDPDLENHSVPQGYSKEEAREAILTGKLFWEHEGECINSANEEISLNGKSVREAKTIIIGWLEEKGLGKGAVNYKLRDWLFSRQRYWGEPFPILHFEDGTKRALTLDELPLEPPPVSDYKPSPDGKSPLSKKREWVEITDPKTGKKALRETNTMPQWAGSCWYYLRFCDPGNTEKCWEEALENYWMPVDLYVGGAEHAVLHLLYARFWHKVFFDCGLVSTKEPFARLCNQGIVTSRSYQLPSGAYVATDDVEEKGGKYVEKGSGEALSSQIEKMSKSKLNGVSPDEVIEEFGADALRLYVMFMGPFSKEKVWNTRSVSGPRRFLARFFDLFESEKVSDEETEEAHKLTHRMCHEVSKDLVTLSFNTAIAKMMEWINDFSKLSSYPKASLKMATQALMPFAPHMAEELWEKLGETGLCSLAPYPQIEEKYLEDAIVTYVVQVNGKLRGKLDLPKDQERDVIAELAKNEESISRHLNGKEIRKVIFVPNKLLNFVAT